MLCDQSCVYSRFDITPAIFNIVINSSGQFNSLNPPSFVQVYQPSQFVQQPTVSLVISDTSGNVLYSISAEITGQNYQSGPFSLQIIGTFSGSLTEFGSNSVIISIANGEAWYGQASLVNSPVAGSIGEVQGQNWQAMENGASYFGYNPPQGLSDGSQFFHGVPEWNYLKYDPSLIQASYGGQSTNYAFAGSALNSLLGLYPKFPQTIGGNLWDVNALLISSTTGIYSANMSSILSSSAAVYVTLGCTNSITVTRTINVVCPVASYLNASGCYTCTMGSTVLISAKSVCSDGPVIVSASDPNIVVNTNVLILNSTLTTFVVQLQTPYSANSFYLILTGSGSNTSVLVSFTATLYNPLGNNTGYNSSGGTNNTGTGGINFPGISFANAGAFFGSLFSGAWSWWQYLVAAVAVVVTVVLFLLSLPYIIQGFKSSSAGARSLFRRKKSKEELPTDYEPSRVVNRSNPVVNRRRPSTADEIMRKMKR